MDALRFHEPQRNRLRELDQASWIHALDLCDKTLMSLPLADACMADLPGWVQQRLEGNLVCVAKRAEKTKAAIVEINRAFEAADLEYLVLKGYSKVPDFIPDFARRIQADHDYLLLPGQAQEAKLVLERLGYEAADTPAKLPIDHLPVMVRKTGWRWHGDYYDTEIPPAVDLHFRLWDEHTEEFAAPGHEEFWNRRRMQSAGDLKLPTLHRADAVAFHCMHLIRHLLRGSTRLTHVYELAWFLHRSSNDDDFWAEWQHLHQPGLRRLQAIAFGIAENWFANSKHECVRQELEQLPHDISNWIARYGQAPVDGLIKPNKNELWLHLSLLDSWGARRRVFVRRVFPARIPDTAGTMHVPTDEITPTIRRQSQLERARFVAGRLSHHTHALPSVLWNGLAWLWRRTEMSRLDKAFFSFLGAASVFNLGAYFFFLLFNLHLLDKGYKEDTLGTVGSMMTAGSLFGTLVSARLLRAVGLRTLLTGSFLLAGIVSAARVLAVDRPLLLVCSFLSGVVFSFYAVSVSPSVAQLSTAKTRARAFSLFFTLGIGIGVLGGMIGGQLPALLGSKQNALLLGCAVISMAALPASRLHFPPIPDAGPKLYPKGPFIKRFLLVLALWSLATGAVNPLFSAFLSKMFHATVEQVGFAYSFSHVAQVIAILCAPVLLKRAGLISGIGMTQLAAAGSLALMSVVAVASPGVVAATLVYTAYVAFQYMGEPGIYTLLMNRTPPEQHSGASSLNFLVIYAAQIVAATGAGYLVTATDYSTLLGVTAALATVAALLVWKLPAD